MRSMVSPLGRLGMFGKPTGTVFVGDDERDSEQFGGEAFRCSAILLFLTACRVLGGDKLEIRYAFFLRFYKT